MKANDANKYMATLIAAREEIAGASLDRTNLRIVQCNEQIETAQLAGLREFAARALEHETGKLMQIGAALNRIHSGDFGTCLECEEPISPKRLAAVPWAAYCLHCQELREAQEAPARVEPKLAA